MKRLIYCITILFLQTACEKQISIIKLQDESKLLLYAMPTDSDEFLINISTTLPISGDERKLDIQQVQCWTNGIEDEVTYVETIKNQGPDVYIYKAKGHHKSGDVIRISVRDAYLETATASTIIPEPTDVKVTELETVEWDNSNHLRFHIHFTDKPTNDYYAIRIVDSKEWGIIYQKVDTKLEPIFNHIIDSNLEAWNSDYQCLYAFSDQNISTSNANMYIVTSYDHSSQGYELEFYTLSKDYYLMLRHINDQLSSELNESGFSPMTSTYSNVKGGYGCVAGYICRSKKLL